MNTFIITAGGVGKRMGGNLPKQFLLIKNKPVLLLTLERFYEVDPQAEIFITLPEDWSSYWLDILKQFNCEIPHKVISGGTERYDSIKNAIEQASGEIISIHDGVRPFVNVKIINDCIASAKINGSGIPYLPLKESIRQLENGSSKAIDRSKIISVQTPQCFQAEIIKKAYTIPFHSQITDDASLVEEAGFPIHLVEGNEENIKITTPFDLQIGIFLL